MIHITNDLISIEGGDITGKHEFFKSLPNWYASYESYLSKNKKELSIASSVSDKWAFDFGVYELLDSLEKQSHDINLMNLNLAIIQGIASQYVFTRLYGGKFIDKSVLEYYANKDFFKNYITHYHIKHKNLDSAKKVFDLASKETNHRHFNTFSDYWIRYNEQECLFREAYSLLKIDPIIVENNGTSEWF